MFSASGSHNLLNGSYGPNFDEIRRNAQAFEMKNVCNMFMTERLFLVIILLYTFVEIFKKSSECPNKHLRVKGICLRNLQRFKTFSFYLNSYNGLFIKCGQHVGGNLTFLILRQNIQNIFDEFHWSKGQEEPPLVLLESSLDNVLQQ